MSGADGGVDPAAMEGRIARMVRSRWSPEAAEVPAKSRHWRLALFAERADEAEEMMEVSWSAVDTGGWWLRRWVRCRSIWAAPGPIDRGFQAWAIGA